MYSPGRTTYERQTGRRLGVGKQWKKRERWSRRIVGTEDSTAYPAETVLETEGRSRDVYRPTEGVRSDECDKRVRRNKFNVYTP